MASEKNKSNSFAKPGKPGQPTNKAPQKNTAAPQGKKPQAPAKSK